MSSAAEEAQFELEVGDAVETEVEIETEDTEADAALQDVSQEPDSKQEDELENYSESVQKRINRLTKNAGRGARARRSASLCSKRSKRNRPNSSTNADP